MKKILLFITIILGLSSLPLLAQGPNMSRYITLTVRSGENIKLNFKAAQANTPVRIVSGTNTQDITVGTNWYAVFSYDNVNYTVTSDGTTMTIYGDIVDFNCSYNRENLTSLDLSNNTQLTELECNNNRLTSLDVRNNTQLTYLNCRKNRLTSLDVRNNTQLTGLNCYENGLTSLDVRNNTQLTWLECSYNRLTSLDVRNNTQLTSLGCVENGLTSLDVSNNTQLTWLECSYNRLTSLDVSNNTQLITLGCSYNRLTSLDVSNNTQLNTLSCHGNQLTSLDVHNNTKLTELGCSSNQLTSLDVSKNTQLDYLDCTGNQLTSLDVSKNTQLAYLQCGANKFTTESMNELYCSLPDRQEQNKGVIKPLYTQYDANHAEIVAATSDNARAKNWDVKYEEWSIQELDVPSNGNYDCSNTNPTPNMSKYITLTVQSGKDIRLNFRATQANTPVRIVSGTNTQDITVGTDWYNTDYTVTSDGTTMTIYGDITSFSCSNNQLTSLDVSNNTQLTDLWCSSNHLTSLDLSNNTQLTTLECVYNQLTSLDVSNSTQLTRLWCFSNQLTSLDLSNSTQLTRLWCQDNRLTSLDLSNNTQLTELFCNENRLTSLDVSNNTQLTTLVCSYNRLTSLDVSKNTQLTGLSCSSNQLTSLDLSNNTQLTGLWCQDNRLTSLDLSNNTQLTTLWCQDNRLTSLDLSNNTQLTELYCDGNKFTTESMNELYCSLPDRQGQNIGVIRPVYKQDDANHAEIVAATSDNARAKNWEVIYDVWFGLYIPSNGNYECPNSRVITLSVVAGKEIKLDFKADAPNSIVRIEGGDNSVELTVGTSWYNGGKSKEYTFRSTTNTITITGAVHSFNCSDNGKNLKAISVLYNKSLNSLFCNGNDIKEIDLRNNHKLTTLECANNYITNLDLTNNTYLSSLNCSNNQLTDLNVTVNNLLTYINANDNLISVIDVTNNDALEALHCSGNQMPNIDLSRNTKLKELSVARNQLKELDLDDNKALIYLHCEGNELAELDLAANVNLKTVYCYDNLFDTLAVNRLYCSLPAKESDNKATIYPLNLVGDSNGKDVAAATSNNAREKNWNVRYAGAIDIEVPSKGKYDCKLHPNMKRFITLHVAKDKDIMLNFASDADITPIRIMSGKNVIKDLTIGTVWYDLSSPRQFSVNASDSILTIYGNITKFSCADNKENVTAIKLSNNKELTHLDISNNNISTIALANAPEVTELYIDRNPIKGINLKDNLKLIKLSCYSNHLTALDLSANTEIKKLYCYDNPFNTDAVNNLYCSLPYTKGKPGICYTLNTTEDTHHEAVVGATSKNARRRNWEVKYFNNDYSIQKDIPSNGNLVCDGDLPDPNMGKYITLTVTKGKEVKISMRAAADSTTVRVVNGTKENDVLASTDIVLPAKEPDFTYTTEGTTLTFYGDINRFECIGNEDAITGIDVSNNPSLVVLFCQNTKIESIDLTKNTELEQFSCSNSLLKSLDVSKNTKLSKVSCNNNKLTSLNVSNNTELTSLFCNYNKITAIDISNNTKLGMFNCAGNKIGSIDFSNNTELGMIWCYDNNLTSLDLSNNKKLNFVQCHGNPFNTEAMNKIYCLLPEVESEADFYPLDNEQDANHAAIVEATSDNARKKKWNVKYWNNKNSNQDNIPNNGGYDCKTGKNSVYEYTSSGITVFPNPADGKVQVNLDSEVNETLILVDLTGRALLTTDVVAGRANIDVSNLTAGTYFIRVGNRIQKLTVK